VERNLLEKAFAYTRGSVSFGQKISHLQETYKYHGAEITTISGNFGIGS